MPIVGLCYLCQKAEEHLLGIIRDAFHDAETAVPAGAHDAVEPVVRRIRVPLPRLRPISLPTVPRSLPMPSRSLASARQHAKADKLPALRAAYHLRRVRSSARFGGIPADPYVTSILLGKDALPNGNPLDLGPVGMHRLALRQPRHDRMRPAHRRGALQTASRASFSDFAPLCAGHPYRYRSHRNQQEPHSRRADRGRRLSALALSPGAELTVVTPLRTAEWFRPYRRSARLPSFAPPGCHLQAASPPKARSSRFRHVRLGIRSS